MRPANSKDKKQPMKLENVKVFVVGNPPPGYGGRYFVFLKLRTACGIEGVGEVYAATFGPKIIASMIEDVFARHFLGRSPFHIEALWRECHGTGFTLRPDLSLMSVVSGLEMACWDIIGKSLDQPVYQLLGGRVHERLRTYTYLYPADGEGEDFYHDAERSAARAAQYLKQGFTGVKFDPTGGFSAYDPRQPTQEQIERTVRLVRLVREAVQQKRGPGRSSVSAGLDDDTLTLVTVLAIVAGTSITAAAVLVAIAATRHPDAVASGAASPARSVTARAPVAPLPVVLLSQGRPVIASSVQQGSTWVAANAVDGNTGTRWSSSFSDPQWLEVDLGAVHPITKVVLDWEDAYAVAFQIQVSDDGVNWTDIYSTTTGGGGSQTLPVSGTGRYVRMYGTQRGTQYGYSLWEFQVFGR